VKFATGVSRAKKAPTSKKSTFQDFMTRNGITLPSANNAKKFKPNPDSSAPVVPSQQIPSSMNLGSNRVPGILTNPFGL
jgi:hypothetical protein